MKILSFCNKYCQWFRTTTLNNQMSTRVIYFTEKRAAHVSLHPSPGCMQVSRLQAERPRGWDERFFFFFQSMFLVGREGNATSYLGWTGCLESGKGGGSQGVNMKTDPYGEEGVWSNERSVSARACVEASG